MLDMTSMMSLRCSRRGCSQMSTHLARHLAVAQMYAYQEGWRYVPERSEPEMWCSGCAAGQGLEPSPEFREGPARGVGLENRGELVSGAGGESGLVFQLARGFLQPFEDASLDGAEVDLRLVLRGRGRASLAYYGDGCLV